MTSAWVRAGNCRQIFAGIVRSAGLFNRTETVINSAAQGHAGRDCRRLIGLERHKDTMT